MKRLLLLLIFCAFQFNAIAEKSSATLPNIESVAFSKKLQKTLKLTVPVIGVEELAKTCLLYTSPSPRDRG